MELTKKSIGVIIALFIVCSAEPAHSQSVSIGARGGISIPNLSSSTDNPISQGYSSILGGDAAIFVNIRFSDLFSIQPMLEFSQQGGQKDGLLAFPVAKMVKGFSNVPVIPPNFDVLKFLKKNVTNESKYFFLKGHSKSTLNYLMLPVLAKFGWNLGPATGNHFRIFVGAGPYVGYLLSAHQTYSNMKSEFYNENGEVLKLGKTPLSELMNKFTDIKLAEEINGKQDISSNINQWNYGISGMVGIAYHFGRNSIFISGGGNYSFNKIQQDSNLGKNHTGAATVSFGYAYKL